MIIFRATFDIFWVYRHFATDELSLKMNYHKYNLVKIVTQSVNRIAERPKMDWSEKLKENKIFEMLLLKILWCRRHSSFIVFEKYKTNILFNFLLPPFFFCWVIVLIQGGENAFLEIAIFFAPQKFRQNSNQTWQTWITYFSLPI